MMHKFWICLILLCFTINIVLTTEPKKYDDLTITLKDAATLHKFRNKVTPMLTENYMKTDFYLLRWLRSTDFDVSLAETMLAENLQWRKQNKMDSINLEEFHDMKRDFPTSLDTTDKEGRPIGTLDMQHWNIRNAIVTGRGERLLRYISMLMENVTNEVIERQKLGMNVTQWIVVMNADGLNMITHGCPACIRIWLQFMHILDNYYPGWMNEFIAIEASPAIYTLIDIMRPFLSSYTRERMRIFGNRKWMTYLDSKISRDQRRELYGGSKP